MESRLKERLTGAAILVALIVLVVPEMFHGPRSAGPAGAPAAANGPQVRSYTIDLTNSTGRSSPEEAPPPASQDSAAAGPRASALSPAAGPAASTAGSAGLAASTASPVQDRPATAATAAAAASAAAPAGWSVQLGLFAKDGNAQRLMLNARAKGFSTRISRTEPKGLYRVWIAGLTNRSAAEQMSRKLHAAGLPAAIIRVR